MQVNTCSKKEVAVARPKIFRFVKLMLAKSGLRPSRFIGYINGILEFGQWLRAHKVPLVLESRMELYTYLQKNVIGDVPIDYLEFGVWEGKSLKAWMNLNTHPGSRFIGFDSFEGLPEDWGHFAVIRKKGTFSTGGDVPDIEDQRLSLVKGYFQETLVPSLKSHEPENRLLIHCDADLYTSTLYPLTVLNPYIVPGTIIIFDEFFTVDHEFKAFADFTRAYNRRYRVIAASGPYDQMAIEITE